MAEQDDAARRRLVGKSVVYMEKGAMVHGKIIDVQDTGKQRQVLMMWHIPALPPWVVLPDTWLPQDRVKELILKDL